MEVSKKMKSLPSLTQRLVLDTEEAQRVYQRTFSEILKNLYYLSVIARISSDDERAIDELNEQVEVKFVDFFDCLEDEAVRLSALCYDNAVTALPTYSMPLEVDVDVSSPMAKRYLQLLIKLDRIVKLLDSLWLSEHFTAKQKLRGTYEWQRKLVKVANQVREARNQAKSFRRVSN